MLLEEISQVEDLVDELGEEEDNGDIIDTMFALVSVKLNIVIVLFLLKIEQHREMLKLMQDETEAHNKFLLHQKKRKDKRRMPLI